MTVHAELFFVYGCMHMACRINLFFDVVMAEKTQAGNFFGEEEAFGNFFGMIGNLHTVAVFTAFFGRGVLHFFFNKVGMALQA